MKPKRVTRTLLAEMLDTARNVGSTPSTTHGWRPTSATIQPDSAAIQGSGRRERQSPKQPARSQNRPRRYEIEGKAEQKDKEKAKPDHETERPKQQSHGRHRTPGGLFYFSFGRVLDIRADFLEKKRIAEIVGVLLELSPSVHISLVGA